MRSWKWTNCERTELLKECYTVQRRKKFLQSLRKLGLGCIFCNRSRNLGPICTRPYFAKLIDRCVNNKLSRVRMDDISGTNFRLGQTNIRGSDGLSKALWNRICMPLSDAVLEQLSADAVVDIKFRPWETKTKLLGRPVHGTKTKYGLVRIGPYLTTLLLRARYCMLHHNVSCNSSSDAFARKIAGEIVQCNKALIFLCATSRLSLFSASLHFSD